MKKLISLLLVLVLVISSMPVVVFAAGNPTISFETTFEEDMTIGDTFTVKAKLANNPVFLTATLSLDWDDTVVEFKGFDKDRRGSVVSDVLIYGTVVANDETGKVTCADTVGYEDDGVIFTANFEIIGSGDVDLGLKDADATEFQMKDTDGQDVQVSIDYSAISGLSVARPAGAGAEIPESLVALGVSAITANNGGTVTFIDEMGELEYDSYGMGMGMPDACAPQYEVTVTPGVTEIYVSFPNTTFVKQTGPDGEDWVGAGYAVVNADTFEGGMAGLTYNEPGKGTIVTVPVTFTSVGFSDESVPQSALKSEDSDYFAVGPKCEGEDSALVLFSIAYGSDDGEEEEELYDITVEQTTGGTVTVTDQDGNNITEAAEYDTILINPVPADGYKFVKVQINDEDYDLGEKNGCYIMGTEDITVSAVFEEIAPSAPETYHVTIGAMTNGDVTPKNGAYDYAAGAPVELVVTPAEGYERAGLTMTYGVDGATQIVAIEGTSFNMPAADVTISASFQKIVTASGYTFATSADVSAENDGTATVSVKITGHSDDNVKTYNAYDVTLSYDSDKLEYQDYAGAVKSDNGRVDVDEEKGTIRIIGCGADKAFGTEIAALTFKVKAEGSANVSISKVQVSNKDEVIAEDAPEASAGNAAGDNTADSTPSQSVIVVPYTVTKPSFVSGNDKVLPGETYTFSYTDTTNYDYTDLKVTVGDAEVTPAEKNGVYTIENVEGAIEITATRTPKSYDVTKPSNVNGPDKATYGTDYVFTVTPSEGKEIESVAVSNGISYTINENGEYVIAGTAITGAFTITVTEKDKAPTETTITFTGVGENEVVGGLTQTTKIGKAFSFALNKDEKYTYEVKVGETVLTETNGSYTISADLVVAEGVTVVITKTLIKNLKVEVSEYVKVDGAAMFLVKAKWDNHVLAYGEEGTMFYSTAYTLEGEAEAGAYCWLVLSTEEMNTMDAVKAAAEEAIVVAASGAEATAVAYDCDVNGTLKVDVNDAQLVYDMYNATYMEFTVNLTMLKFLKADMNGDGKLGTQDVAAIISNILAQSETNA